MGTTITHSYATGRVEGNSSVGGLVGRALIGWFHDSNTITP